MVVNRIFFNNFVIAAFPCLFSVFRPLFPELLVSVNQANVFDWGTNVIGHHTLAVEYIKQIFL
ncbi:hypothetical protein ELI_2090 [Eubacterium callanderi]|uniref:Uncharacterized protein n=1 Tax=Eubacterium callanderi TaxID=53442 RepID=E3GML0_9FIRM|nr:hypothetical protein ELI_2090 [Eubacterium callanderi]